MFTWAAVIERRGIAKEQPVFWGSCETHNETRPARILLENSQFFPRNPISLQFSVGLFNV